MSSRSISSLVSSRIASFYNAYFDFSFITKTLSSEVYCSTSVLAIFTLDLTADFGF